MEEGVRDGDLQSDVPGFQLTGAGNVKFHTMRCMGGQYACILSYAVFYSRNMYMGAHFQDCQVIRVLTSISPNIQKLAFRPTDNNNCNKKESLIAEMERI